MIVLANIIAFIVCFFVFFNEKKEKPEAIEQKCFKEFWEAKAPILLEEQTDEPNTVILKEPSFDISKIKEYTGKDIQKFEFRPQNFTQFIGQADAKERAKTIIKSAKRGMKSHFLVDGIKGHGKTTFVELIGKELDAHIIERVGKQIDEKSLIDIINEINASTKQHTLLFIDEIDSMDWKIVKILNPIIESFKTGGKRIKPFILAGATINKHKLIAKNPDTLDRIVFHIKFSRYINTEIGQIIDQYTKQLYKNENISQEIINKISNNCKFNPRTSIGLLGEYVVEKDIDKVLKNCKIINKGLTTADVELLKVLSTAKRAMGANSLAMKVGLSEKEYTTEFEPFLVEYDYINRVPSRVITDKGRKFLEEVK